MACSECGNDDLSQMMGFEDPAVYDGIIAWQCLRCGFAWPRWEPDFGARYTAGAGWAERINFQMKGKS